MAITHRMAVEQSGLDKKASERLIKEDLEGWRC